MRSEIAAAGDVYRIMDIWRYCFGDPEEYIKWYFDNKFEPNNTLVIRENGLIVSNLQMVPYALSIRSVILPASYIVGVATLPEARNNGHMNILIRDALQHMKSKGIYLAPLYPFQYRFYQKYGWETCYKHLQYKIDLQQLNGFRKYRGSYKSIIWDQDIPSLAHCYAQSMEKYTGFISRTAEDWHNKGREHLSDGGYGYIVMQGKSPVGYILYHIHDKEFWVDEMVFCTSEAKNLCLSFIVSHSSQTETACWVVPSDDETYLNIDDARGRMMLNPFAMLRIIDAAALLEVIPVQEHLDGKVRIKVTDSYAPWNEDIFALGVYRGKLTVERETNNDWDAACSIGCLTQMVVGFQSPAKAAFNGSLQVRTQMAVPFLEALFPEEKTMMYEMY